ncbi:MAG: ABC transporter substrate-binding protein [Bacteroidetes bacterium]|nr:ABC transporter substrate-binding protein [Bacteroidota bacterium]
MTLICFPDEDFINLMRTKDIIVTLCKAIILCLVLSFPACKKESPAIRIGMTLWPGYEFIYLAHQKGFFKEAGVEIQLFDFVSLSDSRRAFERGQIDIVTGTIVELMIVRENSYKSPQAFYVTDFSNGADVILGRKPIQSIPDLIGKRVGVEPASLDLLTLNLALQQNQIDVSEVILVPMAQNDMKDRFEQQEVDAICTYPPTSVKVLNTGDANILFNSSQIPGYIVDVLMADELFIDVRIEDLAKIIQCIDRAIQYTKDHPDEALDIMAKHEQISVMELQEAYEGMSVEALNTQIQYFAPNGQLVKASETAFEILRETDVIQRNIPINELINQGPVTMALSNVN